MNEGNELWEATGGDAKTALESGVDHVDSSLGGRLWIPTPKARF